MILFIISVMVMVGAVVGTLIVQSTVDAATTALGGDVRAWRIVIAVYALCGLLCHLFCIACTRERCIPSTSAQEEVPHVDIKLELRALLANKYWLLAIGSVFFGLFSTSILGGAGMYYAKGVLGDTAYYASFANVMAVTQLFFLFVAILFVPRIGKRNIILIGMGIITLAALFQGIFPPSLTSAVIFAGLKGIGAGFAGAVFYALLADTIDYGEWKVGQKAEGVGMSAVTFATKIAQGLSTVLLGWIIDFGGYDGAALTQTNRAVFAVNSAFNFIPAFCCGCVVVIMLFYDLDKKFPDIQKELEDRRNMN